MSPQAVQKAEAGMPLAARPAVPAALSRADAYVDVIRGKTAAIVYGFVEGRLVYVAYRFKLKARDRAFSQAIGHHLKALYGPSDQVGASADGRTINVHWSVARTIVEAQFAPRWLHVHFWDRRHRTHRAGQPATVAGPER